MKHETPPKLRRLAKSLERDVDPSPLTPTTIGKQTGLALIEAGLALYLDADDALTKAREFGGRGYAGGGQAEGRGKGGHTSPTENAAFTDDNFNQRADELTAQMREASGLARLTARGIADLLSSAPPLTEKDAARCSEFATGGCEDLAVKDRRCQRCYDYLRRHPEEQHVPAAEIARRKTRDRLPVS